MLEFEKLEEKEQLELMNLIQKNAERSGLDNYHLFTENMIEKSKIYLWCYRFLFGIYDISDKKSQVHKVIKAEVDRQRDMYRQVSNLIFKIESTNINRHSRMQKLQNLILKDSRIHELIDAYSILLERQSILSMSRLKGVMLEGQSGKEFKKVFSEPMGDMTQNLEAEEIIDEEKSDEEPSSTDENKEVKETKEEI